MASLEERARAARKRADELEQKRLEATVVARRAAVEAAALEEALERMSYAAHVAAHGEPQRAPINVEASTEEELKAALASGQVAP